MSQYPWMFLVRVRLDGRHYVHRVDPFYPRSLNNFQHRPIVMVRRPAQAWPMKGGGVAAVADSVDDCFALIETLAQRQSVR